MSAFLAQNSLYRHVAAVAARVGSDAGLAGGRRAVARIVGRDPESLDEAGVCRAALESLAENFSDGVVAPAFWALLFGLPGILVYKTVNTADSMIGHQDRRAILPSAGPSARLDDLLNLVPARLAGLLIVGCCRRCCPAAAAGAQLRAMMRDARQHRSPNAGWQEAAAGRRARRGAGGPAPLRRRRSSRITG